MKYAIEELIYDNETIIKQTPATLVKTDINVAVVIHVFYTDIFEEIQLLLAKIKVPFDLFITIPEGTDEETIKDLFESSPNIRIYMTENRGRDVLPFLQVMKLIGTQNYAYICKLHTKKTDGSDLGNIWRKLLYFDLIGSNDIVEKTIKAFEVDQNVGMVTGKNTILDVESYMYDNRPKLTQLKNKLDIHWDDNFNFAAGTMFWIKGALLEKIVTLLQNDQLDFEKESGQTDNTLAHAIERLFGLLCHKEGLHIARSPSSYKMLDEHTLEGLASLVLSQEYVDIDVFQKEIATQNSYIKKQRKTIENLEQLAESMRLKNRIKKFIPTTLYTKSTKILGLLKTVKNNPQLLKKVFYYLKRGEISYLITKLKEKSRANLAHSKELVFVEPSQYFAPLDKSHYTLEDLTVDIIIPVYNGFEFLEPLFDSVEQNTTSAYRLIVINDCSPDEKVKPYLLKRLASHSSAIFIDHQENQGFLKSVNEAYAHVNDHFILLNTDTEVPPFWMERLMYPIVHMENVASTTPFTNAGEIASFPNFVADNDIFDNMSVEDLDMVFQTVNPKDFYAQVPTGVGFCMGVNYNLTKHIGMFVEDTFGKGYGEENDWCQRAIKEGYSNLIVPNLFVYHKHGGSFSAEEKQKLLKENSVKLQARHPNYGKDVTEYIALNPHKTLRELLVLMASDKKVGTHLIFDHALGGGANIYAEKRIEVYLKEQKSVLLVQYDFYAATYTLRHRYKGYDFAYKVPTFEALRTLLNRLHLNELFVNNLVSYPNIFETLSYIKELSSPKQTQLVLPIHDFYAISPSYNLLDANGIYNLDACIDNTKMLQNKQEWRTFYSDIVNMPKWHTLWKDLLQNAQQVLCFSHSSKALLLEAYPNLTSTIDVIPHTVDGIEPITIQKDSHKTSVTVGVLGGIDHVKGATIIKEMIKIIDTEALDINIVVIGVITEPIKSNRFKVTGKYALNELENLIIKNKIDIFLIPSIWPETFSYTTQEIMMMQMPLMVFNLGAPAERVSKYDKGYIIDEISAHAVVRQVKELNI
ncbi:MAG: rhamnan synthesis F family protein [Campylobacterota bacterium]|nr:rhamnan synthesis F family protein [Campylobacterota bacterium]